MTNISTKRVYYTDTYLDRLEVEILEASQDENGRYVIFDQTIFHPQGGGQPDGFSVPRLRALRTGRAAEESADQRQQAAGKTQVEPTAVDCRR